MIVSLIAAVSQNGVIGRDGLLPWNLPEDLKRFKETTLGKPIIMGRKTFQSIGRLLPGRRNIIITRQSELSIPGATIVHSLEAALAAAEADVGTDGEVFVIGGAEIYGMALPLAQRLYLTEVDVRISGDAFFPGWDRAQFRERSCEERPFSKPTYRFQVFERI